MKLQVKNHARICIMISASIMLVAILMSVFGYGINYGIDFAGGLNIEYNMNTTFSQADVETALRNQGLTDFKVSTSGDAGTTLSIRIPKLSSDDEIQTLQSGLETELLAKYPNMDVTNAVASYVGPTAGATLVRNAILSVLLATAMMLVYIALRFDLYSGMAAVIGLLHDVLIMYSFMVILRNFIQMNSSFIAAMLTIVGYSINNTIVIFDRIRENLPELKREPIESLVDRCITDTLTRSIYSSLTTFITIFVLFVMGVSSIRDFAAPLMVGIVCGAYTSVCITGALWYVMKHVGKNKYVPSKAVQNKTKNK